MWIFRFWSFNFHPVWMVHTGTSCKLAKWTMRLAAPRTKWEKIRWVPTVCLTALHVLIANGPPIADLQETEVPHTLHGHFDDVASGEAWLGGLGNKFDHLLYPLIGKLVARELSFFKKNVTCTWIRVQSWSFYLALWNQRTVSLSHSWGNLRGCCNEAHAQSSWRAWCVIGPFGVWIFTQQKCIWIHFHLHMVRSPQNRHDTHMFWYWINTNFGESHVFGSWNQPWGIWQFSSWGCSTFSWKIWQKRCTWFLECRQYPCGYLAIIVSKCPS